MTSLAERLAIAAVSEDEVADLLNEHFGFAAERSPGTVEYGRQGEPAAIVLLYSKRDRIKEVRAGPGLRESDIKTLAARIDSELRASTGRSVAREIVFCSVPVTGYYRTREVQILPAPPEAPRPPVQGVVMAQHPFTLEFPFAASTNPWIQVSRRSRTLRQLVLFLNVVLDGSISEKDLGHHHAWVLVPRGDPSRLSTEFCQEGYWGGGFAPADDFADPADTPRMTVVKSGDYFHRWGYTGKPLEVPDILDALFTKFHSLAVDTREIFLRAAFWYRHASLVSRFARSASFVALISAIEALLPDEVSAPNCETCGQSMQRSISSRFVELLENLAPGNGELSSDRRKLYAIRSKLAHGSTLLRSDEDSSSYLHPERTREWQESAFAYRVTRIALTNWLLRQPTS